MLPTNSKLRDEALNSQSKEIIGNVYTYLKNMRQRNASALPGKHVAEAVAEATGVSESSVWRIIREKKKLSNAAEFKCKSNGDEQLAMDVAALECEKVEAYTSVEVKHELTEFVDMGESPAELKTEGLPFPKVKEEPIEIAPVDSLELALKKERLEFLPVKSELMSKCREEIANRIEFENPIEKEGIAPLSGKTSLAKKGVYGKWTTEQLRLAVAAYLNGDYGLNECSRIYHIPKPTLKRHAENKNIEANGDVKKFGRNRIFSSDIETELEKHILAMVERTFVVKPMDVRKLVFQIAKKYGIPHTFNVQQQMAGTNWYYKFMKRHPRLSSVVKTKGLKKKDKTS